MTYATNTLADCLDRPHPTPGCFNLASYRLPYAISNMSFISGMGTALSRVAQPLYPNAVVNDSVGFVYSNLHFT
jgi:hypothetical protein